MLLEEVLVLSLNREGRLKKNPKTRLIVHFEDADTPSVAWKGDCSQGINTYGERAPCTNMLKSRL